MEDHLKHQDGSMLCRDVKRVVYFFLDGSLADNKRQDVDSHMSLCPECAARLNIQTRLRSFTQSRFARMTATAPERLKMRLTRSIRAFRTEWSR